jgi:Leucine-rich repeat (LRR) protein
MKTLLLSLLVFAGPANLIHADDFGDRSKTVTTALETHLKKKASEITAADLETVTELKLPHIHLPAFKDDDFAGLTKMRKLHFFSLFHKRGAPTDPVAISDKVFAKLSNLEELIITDDQLGSLPDDVFAGLTSLKVLELSNVTLPRLPRSMLNLPKIESVYYDGKGMNKDDYETLKKALGDKLKARREQK